MQTDYQNPRENCRRQILTVMMLASSLGALTAGSLFADLSDPAVLLGVKRPIVEGTYQLSPPAIQFDEAGALHLAWFEKSGDTPTLKTVRISDSGKVVGETVQVNPIGVEPDALHQAPGLAVGPDHQLFMTWSSARQGGMFATDLRLARSTDGGVTFQRPVLVNDDDQSINHSFESLLADRQGQVYMAWLDSRNKDKSGAGTIFACSRDNGKSVGANMTIDGMACPCCRPMMALAPDGSLWAAWRKTFDGNVLDIVLAKSVDQGKTFSRPILVQRDGWVFPACPHRGPSVAFDRSGRLYIGWYTEGTDEQPRLLFAVSDDEGKTFSTPILLHTSATSLPDQLRMAVHPDGAVIAVWEEVTGVRKRTVMRVSLDQGRTFGSVQILSDGAKAETPTVAVHPNGTVALAWSEHAWPHNRLVVQMGTLGRTQGKPPVP
ncbi:MAG: glycoside hydrolase [Nitrospira sp.]|nr:glycoside hydrolase [Nitrospira sp.]